MWVPVAGHEEAPADVFCELYRELTAALVNQPTVEDIADIVDSSVQSSLAFEEVASSNIQDEQSLVAFLERSFAVLEDLGGDSLSNYYFGLLARFIERYSIRYDLRRPCQLCPTLPGIFSALFSELRTVAGVDPYLHPLMRDFEAAVRDLRDDPSDGKVKTCLAKQTNLLEGLGRQCAGVTGNTLGAMCQELTSWPHEAVRDAMRALYKFVNDYPGIRHAGTAGSDLRAIEMRDLVAMSIVLMGFSPYVTDKLQANSGYQVS